MPSNDTENLKQIALTRFEKMGFKHFGANAHFSSSTPCSAPGGKFLEAFLEPLNVAKCRWNFDEIYFRFRVMAV